MAGDEATPGLGSGDCTVRRSTRSGRGHVEELPATTSTTRCRRRAGSTIRQTAIWNLYDQPVPRSTTSTTSSTGRRRQYGSEVPPATVDQIRDWYQATAASSWRRWFPSSRRKIRTSPNQIVLVSWTHMMRCSTFDEEAFTTFSEDYRGEGGRPSFSRSTRYSRAELTRAPGWRNGRRGGLNPLPARACEFESHPRHSTRNGPTPPIRSGMAVLTWQQRLDRSC